MGFLHRRMTRVGNSVRPVDELEAAATNRDVLGAWSDASSPASHLFVRFLRGFGNTVKTQGGDVVMLGCAGNQIDKEMQRKHLEGLTAPDLVRGPLVDCQPALRRSTLRASRSGRQETIPDRWDSPR